MQTGDRNTRIDAAMHWAGMLALGVKNGAVAGAGAREVNSS